VSSSTTNRRPDDEVLRLDRLCAGYGAAPVVRDLDLVVSRGEIVALLGPNGAGKTTTLLTISGLLKPLSGRITAVGTVVNGMAPHRIARLGVGHVPEDRALFGQLSALDNLRLARRPGGASIADALEWFPALGALLRRRAALLSGGEQQMLAVARALVAGPTLLIVDEMSLGLAPVIVERLLPTLRTIADSTGIGILLVEQHVHLALEVADTAVVMVHGETVASGPAADVAGRADDLAASYLGRRSEITA
jgi:branched-chain amino acid transport system ATP-binding protein